MTAPQITPRSMYSLRTNVKHNAHYISDFQILYPAGSVLIMHNYYEKRQKYIKLYEKSVFLEMIVISPSRKLAAIILNSDKGQIVIFDMQTLKRKRTLNLPSDSTTNRFETLSFSHDDAFIFAITGEPDCCMVTYKWEKGKVTNITKANYPNHPSTAIEICCCPTSNSDVCLTGQGIFRLMTMNETVWRQYGFQKADLIHITSATWISGEKIICGTSDGKLFCIVNGDIRGVYNALRVHTIGVKEKDEVSLASSSLLVMKLSESTDVEDNSVRALISFPKGFAYSCKTGYVHFFEKESVSKYKKRNVFKISDSDVGLLQEADLNVIKHLSVNISQDKLLATTNRAQLYTARLWGPDLNVAPEIPFRHLGEPLHHGSIVGLATCVWKPIFVTFGETDYTIRLWNHETDTVVLVKQYTEEILSVDIHPMGNFLTVGLLSKLEFSVILLNDIQPSRTLPIKSCKISKFSHTGSYIAIVNKDVLIEIYATITLSHVFTLKGHLGKINNVHWTLDDKKLGSCGMEGAIYVWDALNGVLLRECVTPEVNYFDIAWSSDSKLLYAVASDGCLREITETSIVKTLQISQDELENLVLSRSNLLMFLTANNTALVSVKMPLTDPPIFNSYHYHSTKVTQVALSFDDQTLVSVSQGGSVIIWKLSFAEGKTITMDKNFIYSIEILINKSELEKKILTIKNLSQKLYELEIGQARDMRDTETMYCDKIKEIHEKYTSVLDDLREKIEQTEATQNKELVSIKKDVDELVLKQADEKKRLIENYTNKLMVEYEKVRALDLLKEGMIKDFEEKVAILEKSKEEETNEIIRVYEEKLEEINNLLKETYAENTKNLEEHEKTKKYFEDDADREIVETKAKYESVLREEKELHAALKEETIIMRKRQADAQKERDEIREKAKVLEEQQQVFQSNMVALEKDIADLKAEIVERDAAIEEKGERIFFLKKKIQELDKIKFVLNYKIKELRKQIDPKDREIKERKEQIGDMEFELMNLRKINSSLELQVIELREKIIATEREANTYESKHHFGVITLRQIKVDIYGLYQKLQDFKILKDGVRSLYHKYYKEEIKTTEHFGESDVQRELMTQRDFLEKTIKALKSTLQKNQQNKTDGSGVLKDNVILLEELNDIRKELKAAVTMVKNLEKLVGARAKKSIVPSEAFSRLQIAFKKQRNIKQMYQEVIETAEEETKELNEKVKKMQEKLWSLLHGDQT